MVPVLKSLKSVKKGLGRVKGCISEGEQELEKSAAVFCVSASFWENGVHEADTNDVRSRGTYTDEVKEPQWEAPGVMVYPHQEMLDSIAFWRDGLMHVVCVLT